MAAPTPEEWPLWRIVDRIEALQDDLRGLRDLDVAVARITSDLANFRASAEQQLAALTLAVEDQGKALAARDTVQLQERAANRRALYALAGTLMVALIVAIGGAITAGISP